jgi:hypothetical protein
MGMTAGADGVDEGYGEFSQRKNKNIVFPRDDRCIIEIVFFTRVASMQSIEDSTRGRGRAAHKS